MVRKCVGNYQLVRKMSMSKMYSKSFFYRIVDTSQINDTYFKKCFQLISLSLILSFLTIPYRFVYKSEHRTVNTKQVPDRELCMCHGLIIVYLVLCLNSKFVLRLNHGMCVSIRGYLLYIVVSINWNVNNLSITVVFRLKVSRNSTKQQLTSNKQNKVAAPNAKLQTG